jgi:hypothetical protein
MLWISFYYIITDWDVISGYDKNSEAVLLLIKQLQ